MCSEMESGRNEFDHEGDLENDNIILSVGYRKL